MQCLLEILPRELRVLVVEATANLAMTMPLCAGEIDAMLSNARGVHVSLFSFGTTSACSKIAHRSRQNNIMSLLNKEHPTKLTYKASTDVRNEEEANTVLRYDLSFSCLCGPTFRRRGDAPLLCPGKIILDVRNTHVILCARLNVSSSLFSVQVHQLVKKALILSIDDILNCVEDASSRVVYLTSNLVILDEERDIMQVLNQTGSLHAQTGYNEGAVNELRSSVIEAINRTL